MHQHNNLPVNKTLPHDSVREDASLLHVQSPDSSKIIPINSRLTNACVIENHLLRPAVPGCVKESAPLTTLHHKLTKALSATGGCAERLLRLFIKNGEYVYARPGDIVLVESCDHLVKVYLAINEKIKKAVRYNTLKDFLLLLPQEQFLRIGRFCAVNTLRLSGGNANSHELEFDFSVSIKLKHPISKKAYENIGK